MSLLLDALRKAEQERRLGQPPSALDEPPVSREPEATTPKARRYRSSLLLGLVIVCAIALLLLLAKAPRVAVVTAPDVADAAPPPVATPRPTARVVAVESERLDDLNSLVLPPPPPRPRAVVTASGEVPAGAPSPEDIAAIEDGDETAQPTPEVNPPPSAAAAPAAADDVPPADAGTLGPPRLSDLPPEQRERLPSYRFDVHVWNEDPARRFVLLNGKRYREGDRTDEGPTLVEILTDGIVIDADGLRVRIPRPG